MPRRRPAVPTAARDGVLILHNEPRLGTAWEASDIGVLDQVAAVRDALEQLSLSCRVAAIGRLEDLPAAVAAGPERLVFNLVEMLVGDVHDVTMVPAVCRSLGRECTGGSTPALALTLDKWLGKAVLQEGGVPVPAAVLAFPDKMPTAIPFPAPWLVKPPRADASEGITAASVVHGLGPELAAAVRRIHDDFHQPAMIEQYVAGRELNISLLAEYDQPAVIAIAEIDFSTFPPDLPRIVDFDAKWCPETFVYQNTPRIIPAPLPEEIATQVRAIALAAWAATGSRDYIRVDMRLDEALHPFVLEVNINPDITPECGFAAALEHAGIAYEEFVRRLLVNAAQRMQEADRAPGGRGSRRRPPSPQAASAMIPTTAADRDHILAMLRNSQFFGDHELAVAAEVLNESLDRPDSTYRSLTAHRQGTPAGWACFGATPCTAGTYDIYWLVVAPPHQGCGIGQELMALAEAEIRRAGGRLAVVETAGRAQYLPTRRFYSRIGYRECARLADFYAPGDDKIICLKHL